MTQSNSLNANIVKNKSTRKRCIDATFRTKTYSFASTVKQRRLSEEKFSRKRLNINSTRIIRSQLKIMIKTNSKKTMTLSHSLKKLSISILQMVSLLILMARLSRIIPLMNSKNLKSKENKLSLVFGYFVNRVRWNAIENSRSITLYSSNAKIL